MRIAKRSILRGFWEKLRSPESTSDVLSLSKKIINSTRTNLNQREFLSLISAIKEETETPILEKIVFPP